MPLLFVAMILLTCSQWFMIGYNEGSKKQEQFITQPVINCVSPYNEDVPMLVCP